MRVALLYTSLLPDEKKPNWHLPEAPDGRSNASKAKSVRSYVLARQPTMRREKTSITNATYTKPRHVLTYVKSDTHN